MPLPGAARSAISPSAPPWLVVGVGNPGPEYAGNRHNVGFLVVDAIGEQIGGSFRLNRKGRADVLEGRLGSSGNRVILAKPRAYVNESGGPVSALQRYYETDPGHLVVVHDELDLPFGVLRVKFGGGDNGHNGLKSLRKSLQTGNFFRVRVGIGRPPGRMEPATFVLRDFSPAERKALGEHVGRSAAAVEALIESGLATTQSAFNG